MEDLVVLIGHLVDFWNERMDFLLGLSSEQFVRLFWAFLFLEIPRYLLTDIYALLHFWRVGNHIPKFDRPESYPLISAVLPAHNEEKTIALTVASLLEQDYPNLEIIVVDDGSTDRTARVCRDLADRGLIRFLPLQSRQGKSAALNFGLRSARGRYILFMDTDSSLDRRAISNIIRYFQDEQVGAVSGNLGVRNPNVNVLTRMQAIEYLISITVGRYFRANVGILTIVPGAFGAFRRDLLQRVGGQEPGPGNDSDLTIRTRKLWKNIMFAQDATCLTNVPETWRHWFRQRMRWYRNIVRNRIRKHKDIYGLFQDNFKLSNLWAFVDTIFFAVVLTLVWFVYLIDMLVHYPDLYGFILFANFILHLLLKIVQFTIAVTVSDRGGEFWRLFVYLPFFGVYRILQRLVRTLAVLQELLFRWSYRDPFAPKKVRNEMEVY